MSEDFRIRSGMEGMAGFEQFVFQRIAIFNDSVMDYGNGAGLIQVRMRVLVGRRPVGGPASVADADFAEHRISAQEMGKTFVDLFLFFADLQPAVMEHGQARAVVTAVFEPSQSLEKNRLRLFFANISNDAAHIFYAMGIELDEMRVRLDTSFKLSFGSVAPAFPSRISPVHFGPEARDSARVF